MREIKVYTDLQKGITSKGSLLIHWTFFILKMDSECYLMQSECTPTIYT